MTVLIRQATAGDKKSCLELLQALSSATGGSIENHAGNAFDGLLDGRRGQILVAEEHDHLLGLASVTYNLAMRYGGEYCQLEELVVAPEARGKNIGGQLVEQTIARARARGCREYGLYLVASTEHNRVFYEKYGFTLVGSEMRQSLD